MEKQEIGSKSVSGKLRRVKSGLYWSKKAMLRHRCRSSQRERPTLPLAIALEGQSWGLTALLVTSIALWMVLLERDGAASWNFLFPDDNLEDGRGWSGELVKYVILMAMAAFSAAVAVGALTLNNKPPGRDDWRWRTMRSSFALFLINVMALRQFCYSLSVTFCPPHEGTEVHWASVPAHIFLVVTAVLCTLVSDVLYIRLFGCCVFFCGGVGNGSDGFPDRFDPHNPYDSEGKEGSDNAMEVPKTMEMQSTVVNVDDSENEYQAADDLSTTESAKSLGNEREKAGNDHSKMDELGGDSGKSSTLNNGKDAYDCQRHSEEVDQEITVDVTNIQGGGAHSPNESVNLAGWLAKQEQEFVKQSRSSNFRRWDTEKYIKHGSGHRPSVDMWNSSGQSSSNSRIKGSLDLEEWLANQDQSKSASSRFAKTSSGSSGKVLRRWDTKRLINQVSTSFDEPEQDAEYPVLGKDFGSGRLGGVVEESKEISGPVCELPPEEFPGIASQLEKILEHPIATVKAAPGAIWRWWDAVREEEGEFRYSVWIKIAVFTSICVLMYTCIRIIDTVWSFTDDWSVYRTRIEDNLSKFDTFLKDAGWLDGVDDAMRIGSIKILLYFDSLVPLLKHTSVVGYPLGLLIGLYSLYAVMVQHKRLSRAVKEELLSYERDLPIDTEADVAEINPWPGIEKKYPIGDASYFLAILASTAVLQLYIFGFLLSVVLAMFLNFNGMKVLFELFGFYLLAYLIIFLIDVVVMRIIPKWLVADGLKIKHPRWFFFYMMVFSMVHLVIGLLYALWRVLYVSVTTFVVINRLDINLFTTCKSLDNGHNAFMSMLVLTHLIQMDTHLYKRRLTRQATIRGDTG